MTFDEYLRTEETVAPQELIYGTFRVADAPTVFHQELVAALFLALRRHLRQCDRGTVWFAPIDVILDRERALVVQPDLVVVTNPRTQVTDKVYGAPDLVVEVLSPQPRIGATAERLALFRDHGVRECWLVHQWDGRVEVLQFGPTERRREFRADQPIESAVLPEFRQALGDITAYPPRTTPLDTRNTRPE